MSNNNRYSHSRRVICLLVITIITLCWSGISNQSDRSTLNRYLEDFYNAEPLPRNTYVPYTHWEGGTRELPEPLPPHIAGKLDDVPEAIREVVLERLRQLSGVENIRDQAELARDLGLDSLARTELAVWLEQEFAVTQAEGDTLYSVADVLLAASGTAPAAPPVPLTPPAPGWFRSLNPIEANVRDMVTRFYQHPNQFRYHGKAVISGYGGTADTYAGAINGLRTDGYNIYFVPVLSTAGYHMAWNIE